MATVRFFLRSKADRKVSINVYVVNGRGQRCQTVTGFNIHPKYWNEVKAKPIQNSEENKFLLTQLTKLESHLYSELNIIQAKEGIVDLQWLTSKIKECFNRKSKDESNFLITNIQKYIDSAPTMELRGGKIGLSKNRITRLITFRNMMEDYQKHLRRKILLTDINRSFMENFKAWLLVTNNFNPSYAGKQFDDMRAICRFADENDIDVNPYYVKIKGFKGKQEDRYIITLSDNDLNKIRNLKSKSVAKENVRKWILLGCEFGQRGGDLMKLHKALFKKSHTNGRITIKANIIQQKTNESVTIGTDDPYLIKIIENDFPYPLSSQRFNDLIKNVCEDAGISEVIKGSKYDSKIKRKVIGEYKKHELITSHCFRRTFATIYESKAGIKRTRLMRITGHKRETQFLEYINKREDQEENLDLFFEERNRVNSNEKPETTEQELQSPLKIVR